MQTIPKDAWSAARRWLTLVLVAVTLAACGGGGGGDDTPAPPPLEGTWRVSLRQNNVTNTGGTVPGSSVPSAQQVATINSTSFAQLLGSTSYQAYTVTLSGSTMTITGTSTNLVVVVNSVSTSNYRGCGASCGVGAVVSYDVSVSLTANGTLNGQFVSGSDAGTVTVVYTRIS